MLTLNSNTFFIEGPGGKLETLTENFDHSDHGVMIVCHPHPLHGGTMHNKVVHTLARAGRDLGLATLRFNYRGVGSSNGEYAEGIGETDDLLAVIDWVEDNFYPAPIWLAGFSFGAYVALRASSQRNIRQLITIAPAVNLVRFEGLQLPDCPWLLLQGTADEIVPIDAVHDWLETIARKPKAIYFEGVGHFFHGQLPKLRQCLVEQLSG